MFHKVCSNDGFPNLLCKTSDANGSIVVGQVSLSFFVYSCILAYFHDSVGFPPPKMLGILEAE